MEGMEGRGEWVDRSRSCVAMGCAKLYKGVFCD